MHKKTDSPQAYIPLGTAQCLMLNAQCSMLNVQCSMFALDSLLMLAVPLWGNGGDPRNATVSQCSMFNAQC